MLDKILTIIGLTAVVIGGICVVIGVIIILI